MERDAPLRWIAHALSEARHGRGSVVAIEGGYGLGKSSLAQSAMEAAGQEGMATHSARGRALEQEHAYGVVLQLFEARATRKHGKGLGHLSAAARKAMPLFESEPADRSDQQSFSILHGLYWLCADLARECPLAVVVDDADLADAASLRFLVYLTERVHDLPVALVVTAGSAIRSSDPDVLRQVIRHPATTRLVLEPLSSEGTAGCLRRSVFPSAHPEFSQAIHDAAAGNPLLVHELAALLAAAGIEPVQDASERVATFAPSALSARALARIRPLGSDAERLLRAAAVFGDSAEVRLAAELAGLDYRDAAEAADGLVQAGLLSPSERLTFVHPVVRSAVEADRPPASRAEDHRRAAELLAEEEAPAERVAGHLMKATRSGSGWVVDTLRGAAHHALAHGAPAAAVRYLRRALEEPPARDRRAALVLELGRAEAAAGHPEAVERIREAAERLPDPAQRAHAALESGHMLVSLGRRREAADDFARHIDELSEPTKIGAQLSAALSSVTRLDMMRSGVPPAPVEVPGYAATPAERAALAQLALEAALRGDPREEVSELAERALARGGLLDDTAAHGIAYYVAVGALTVAEYLQTAEIALAAALERAQGSLLGVATATSFRSFAALRRGLVDAAAEEARRALAAERQGWRIGASGARWVLADVMIERDELDAAQRLIADSERDAAEESPAHLTALAARGRLALAGGDANSALAAFTDCGAKLDSLGITNPAVIAWRSGAGRAAAMLGDHAEGAELVAAEIELAERFGALGVIAHALRAFAAVHSGDARVELLEEAVQRAESSQAALERAKTLVDYGAALRRSGRRRDAREPLRQGLLLAQRCGAVALVNFARGEATAAGVRPRRTALRGVEALTPREHQVASLAAQGRSNREIAEALFVTVKTVEWHLKHAYGKLGAESRRDLPAVFSDTSA